MTSQGKGDGPAGPSLGRRAVLKAGFAGAAAAGAVSAFPGVLAGLVASAPEASSAAPELEGTADDLAVPVVAHITDAASGQMTLYVGEREVALRDSLLVQRLLRAAR